MSSLQPWNLATPTDDGQVLLWPEPAQWADLAAQTHDRLSSKRDVAVLDVPLGEFRRIARSDYTDGGPLPPDPHAVWIVTGHQTFPYHAGIWAKSAAADAVARDVGGLAANLNVDHDLPHAGPQIAWPAVDQSGRLIRHAALPLDHDQPFERQPAPAAGELASLSCSIAADLSAAKAGGDAFDPTDLAGGPDATSFAEWFIRMRAPLDARLGLRLHETASSTLAGGDAFLLLAGHVIARAGSFFQTYNEAVETARAATGHLPARPLELSAGRHELPFWTLRAGRRGRGRLFVSDGPTMLLSDSFGTIGPIGREQLRSAETALPALRRILAENDVQLRPRALALTLYARLALADLFIHGVGGAVYDHATNTIIQRFFGMQPPPYAVASATLLLPLEAPPCPQALIGEVRHRVRDMRFNPQRHISPKERTLDPAAALLSAKWAAVERNAALRNLEQPDYAASRQRRAELFRTIRRINADLAGLIDEQIAVEQNRARRLAEQARDAEIASARDYFYGLLPRDKLRALRATIADKLS